MNPEAAPPLALSIAYWLHMLATVVWIGGLTALALFVLPAARRTLDSKTLGAFLNQMQSRLQQIGWFSLATLGVTGMFQMSSSPAYEGFLAVTNSWGAAILAKHLVIGVMILASAYMTWGVLPGLQRLAMLQSVGKEVSKEQLERLRRNEQWTLNLNLALSILVLFLTAWARAVSGN
jgi:uncharacterized membrane protein